jgi:hypothetical protein
MLFIDSRILATSVPKSLALIEKSLYLQGKLRIFFYVEIKKLPYTTQYYIIKLLVYLELGQQMLTEAGEV